MAAPMELVALFCLFYLSQINGKSDEFHEEMFVKPLPSGHVYSHFQFTTKWNASIGNRESFKHYRLFPKAFGEVLDAYRVQELHLTLSQGLWRHEKWGYPIESAPPGAELWVWFQEDVTNIDSTWTDLVNVLSGMFCASLNFMDLKNTITPKMSFRPNGVTTPRYDAKGLNLVRYSALPRENVCTENLTPWKKLLPCASKSGLATLFNAVKLYDASYHSLGVHFRPVCIGNSCDSIGVELSQSLAVVYEPTIKTGNSQDWSIKKLYGRYLGSTCPVASTSKIYVDITQNKTLEYYFTLNPEPSRVETKMQGSAVTKFAVYDIAEFVANNRLLNTAAKYNRPMLRKPMSSPSVYADRFQTGYGQERGGIMSLLYNNHETETATVIYMETLPWFLRLYLHTLKIENFGYVANHIGINGTIVKPLHLHYVPGRDRQRPYHLEMVLQLPPHSTTRVGFNFDRALLKWTEYPPDANHGFYVNSAVLSTVLPSSEVKSYVATRSNSRISSMLDDHAERTFLRVHTETLLVSLPTPDFSMPYNVICLACTVVAIAFGSIHNLTTRRFVVHDPSKATGILGKIKNKIFRKKSAPTDEDKVVETQEGGNEGSTGDGAEENTKSE